MVMPLSRRRAHDLEHRADQLGIERAGRLVEQHHAGSSAMARAIATRCCWPPESWPGVWSARSASPTRVERRAAERLGLGARLAGHLAQRQGHVAERRHVRIEVERLEHHPDTLAGVVDVGPRIEHVDAVDHDPAGRRLLQPVQTAQQRRLARARRPDHEHELALGHRQVDALQYVKGAEVLVQAARVDDRAVHSREISCT
jgi:hypothetical protein